MTIEEEALGLGLPFPPLRERFELLEEIVQACLRMWEGERGDARPFRGRHVRMEHLLNMFVTSKRAFQRVILLNGRMVGRWREVRGRSVDVAATLYRHLDPDEERALQMAAERYEAFLGEPVTLSVREVT